MHDKVTAQSDFGADELGNGRRQSKNSGQKNQQNKIDNKAGAANDAEAHKVDLQQALKFFPCIYNHALDMVAYF